MKFRIAANFTQREQYIVEADSEAEAIAKVEDQDDDGVELLDGDGYASISDAVVIEVIEA
jgi:hypothetical protein